jgi:hypothetical protein
VRLSSGAEAQSPRRRHGTAEAVPFQKFLFSDTGIGQVQARTTPDTTTLELL